ncbi:hypothetical protein D9M71_544730 [compost metagenome]
MVAHAGGTRRKDRHVDATLLQQPKLVAFDRRENLVVADAWVEGRGGRPILGIPDLCFSKGVMQLRFGRVVAVAVDNHERSLRLVVGNSFDLCCHALWIAGRFITPRKRQPLVTIPPCMSSR